MSASMPSSAPSAAPLSGLVVVVQGIVLTDPIFPLPDILEEIEAAGRYAGPLEPGAAHAAALGSQDE